MSVELVLNNFINSLVWTKSSDRLLYYDVCLMALSKIIQHHQTGDMRETVRPTGWRDVQTVGHSL